MIDRGRTPRMRAGGRGARGLFAILAVAMIATLAYSAPALASKPGGTVWLCRPGLAENPCKASRTSTTVTYEGATRHEAVHKTKGKSAAIDCFYVYPTVSEQTTTNANLTIEPQETQIAIDQASRFSQECRVFAPMYPQLTLSAINTPGGVTLEDEERAYLGVLGGWLEYMQRYNKGRGFVLIGHSQGSLMLEQLIRERIDPNPALRKQMVSAIILGGNVLVPEGQTVGGTFQNVPACQTVTQLSCVIAYSSFAKEPPEGAFFGRPGSALLEGGVTPPGTQVLCVNPTLLSQDGSTGNLLPYDPTTKFPGTLGEASPTPEAATPWINTPGLYTAQCKHENGASWLQVSTAPGISEAVLNERNERHEIGQELLGPDWGLHLFDVNEALGNLVNTVAIQSATYGFEH
jgi:hypothetical protein